MISPLHHFKKHHFVKQFFKRNFSIIFFENYIIINILDRCFRFNNASKTKLELLTKSISLNKNLGKINSYNGHKYKVIISF